MIPTAWPQAPCMATTSELAGPNTVQSADCMRLRDSVGTEANPLELDSRYWELEAMKVKASWSGEDGGE